MRLLLAILGSVAGLILLWVLVYLMMPAERLAQIALDRLAHQTGREITIEAASRPTLWPDLMISVEGLEMENPDWAGSRPLLRADAATLRVGWGAVFGDGGTVDRLDLSGADLNLVRAEDGRLSWRNGDASLLPLALRRAEMQNARVRYTDRAGGHSMDIRRVTARVDLDEGSGGSASFTTSGVAQGNVVEMSGTITRAAQFFEGAEQPVRLDLVWEEGQMRFSGRAALAGGAEGDIELDSTDVSPVLQLLGRDIPEAVTRLAGTSIAVEGNLSVAEGGSLHLRDGAVAIGDTHLNAAFDLVPGEDRPLLRGTITGGEIGFSNIIDPTELAPHGSWSRAPYDVSALFALDADLTIRAEALRLAGMDLEGLDLRANLDRGRLVFDIARVDLAGGQLAGQFVVNGRGGLSVGGDLLLANAQTGLLLEQVFGQAWSTGRGSASVEFLGVGDDLFSILDGFEGEGDLSLRQGVLNGVDLPGLARDARDLAEATEFDAVVADFRIRDGVLISDDLRIDAPWGVLLGDGEVDLAERAMEYRLAPSDWPDPRVAPVPVLLNGSWDDVAAVPDREALEAFAAEAAAERARAAEVARILSGALDVVEADEPDGAVEPEQVEETEE